MSRGYDNPRFNQVMLLDLQFCEGVGVPTLDWAKPHHEPNTLVNAPVWTNAINDLTFLYFDGVAAYPHIVTLATDSGDLDFTTTGFSGMCWYYPSSGGNRYIFNKGTNATGWCFYLNTDNEMSLGTRQAAATQFSHGNVLTLNTWQLVGFSRDGATVRVYTNGRERTTTYATHINPDSSTAENFYIGCTNLVGAGWMVGYLWRPRILSRVTVAAEHLAVYEIERHLFGV